MYLITAACIGMFLISQDCQGQEHMGCYIDNITDRLLPTPGEDSVSNTVDTCIDICKSKGKTYAGVELDTECWCGDLHNFSRHGVVTEQGQWCNYYCRGNKSQTCGGVGLLNIYSVCPRGRYHDPGGDVGNCDSECYCNANHICLYSMGQCPGGCHDSWYGTSCSLNASLTTLYSTSTLTEEILFTDNNGPSTTDNTDTSHNTTDADMNGETAITGIVVGVAIALLLMLIVIAVVLVCCYRWRQREPPDSGKEIITLPDDLYGEVDMEAKAACQRKRQEEDGYRVDKEGTTVVNNDLYGSVSNNSYPFEKEDTFGYVNVASKPLGWKKKNGKAAPVESYTMDDARCKSDARQKQPVQSDMETVVDNALYGSPDAEDGGGGGFHGGEDGKSSKCTSPVEPLYDTPKRQSIAL